MIGVACNDISPDDAMNRSTRPGLPACAFALAFASCPALADVGATAMAPTVDLQVWSGTTTAWRARLTSNGSQEGTWDALTGTWAWAPVSSGRLFGADPASGNWSMTGNWHWSRPEFSVDLSASGNLDPFISYGMVAHNTTAAPLTFLHTVTAPIAPSIPGPNLVRASLSGALTDSTGNGVALVAAPDRAQDGDSVNEVQLFLLSSGADFTTPGAYTTAGVDVGGNASAIGPGTATYGSFAAGLATGPTGPWNWMQTRTRFTLSGDNDVAVITGFAEIAPVPEAENFALLLAGLAALTAHVRRRGRRAQ